MGKIIKVICINDKCFAQLTENKVYEVKNSFKSDGELFYDIDDDDGDHVSMYSSRFEVVEEKPEIKTVRSRTYEAIQNNWQDDVNRNKYNEKPIVQTTDEWVRKYAIAGSIVESQDWMKPKTVKRKTGQSIRYKWQFNAHTYNLIDGFNRMKCEEKKFKGMHVPYMRDIVENLHEMKAPSMPEKLRSQSIKVIVLDEVDVYPLTDINLNNEIDSFNRHLKCNTHHIETPPDKKVEYHEPGFKSKWDTVGI